MAWILLHVTVVIYGVQQIGDGCDGCVVAVVTQRRIVRVCVCVCVLCVCAEVCTALCVCVCGNINLLQEKLIEDLRISARKNGLAIIKSTFNRVTKRGLKCHPFKMHARK